MAIFPFPEIVYYSLHDSTEIDLRKADLESQGLPVGVQVVSRHWREDVALAVMRVLEAAARSNADYPRTPVVDIDGVC